VAIFFEVIGMRRTDTVAWVALAISDAARQLYGRREKAPVRVNKNETQGVKV